MISFIKNTLSCPQFITLAMAIIAAMALGMALVSQYFFDLQPCVLCIYQRYPYGFIIAFGLLGFLMSLKDNDAAKKAVSVFMAFIGITFLINSIIAFYHTGVEQKWWPSHLEGCAVPTMTGDMTDILADIQSRTKAVRCDEIPWSDPILNLSMANYNVLFCLGLGVIALISMRLIWQRFS